jgi:PilZ domain
MGRRKEPRTQARLPVKLWGTDAQGRPFIEPVHTRNVSMDGALLEGVHCSLRAGDEVGLTYGEKKGRFKVAWVGEKGERENQVGLEAVNKGKCIFDVRVEAPGPDPFMHGGRGERRQHPRFVCNASIEIRVAGAVAPLRGKLADLSLGGCYAEMMNPLRVGTKLELAIWLESSAKISTAGMVTSSHAGFGVGIKFIGMLSADRECLREYLQKQSAVAAKGLNNRNNQARGASASANPSKFIR